MAFSVQDLLAEHDVTRLVERVTLEAWAETTKRVARQCSKSDWAGAERAAVDVMTCVFWTAGNGVLSSADRLKLRDTLAEAVGQRSPFNTL